jgi:hypothetical protein
LLTSKFLCNIFYALLVIVEFLICSQMPCLGIGDFSIFLKNTCMDYILLIFARLAWKPKAFNFYFSTSRVLVPWSGQFRI